MSTLTKSASTGASSQALTPHAILAISLLYMASSHGVLADAPKRHLLNVLGGDDAALERAAASVDSMAFAQFLQAAPNGLSTQEKLCVLVNVCDVLVAYSSSDPEKLALFDRMLKAFGLSTDAFAPYYKTIVLKNSHVVLGAYDNVASRSEPLTAHVALATSLLYMMAAGGALSSESMAQLGTLMGQFEGVQAIALTYIRRVKFNQFLPQASARLSGPQKLYILVHACDALLSDGYINDLERQMFQAMLGAFGYSEPSFRPYLHALEVKNDIPEDEPQGAKGAPKARTFQTRTAHSGDKTKSRLGADGVDANVAFINPSANSGANLQKVGTDQTALNRQTLDSQGASINRQTLAAGDAAINRQTLAGGGFDVNRQALDVASSVANQQVLPEDGGLGENRQAVGVDRFDDQRALITEEERLKDLDFIIDNLQRKIDQFERKNKKVLHEATQAKLTHPPDPTDEIAQISTPDHPKALATAHLQVEKAPERILDLHDEARDWTVLWISSTVAIICFTCAMALRIVLG